jgi:hypothetical protein
MDGVLNMDGDQWRAHSRALTPLFSSKLIAKHYQSMHESATRHAKAWLQGIAAEGGVLPPTPSHGGAGGLVSGGSDILDAVRGISMEILIRWAYGMQTDNALAKELARELTAYGRLVTGLTPKPLLIACNYAALHACGKRIKDVTRRIIAMKTQNKDSNADPDGVSLMLAGGFTLDDIAGTLQAYTMSITWCTCVIMIYCMQVR